MSASDHTLLEHWQEQRDPTAFRELVSRHGAMVYAACRRVLRNSADAEEVAQECFLALAETDPRSIRVPGAWLHRSATHRSLNRIRADKRRKKREQRYAGARPQVTEPTWNELQQFIDEAITELPEELAVLVTAHFLEGVSQSDLSKTMDTSPSTLSRRISRGVDEIRNKLRKRGIMIGAGLLSGMLAEAKSDPIPKTLYSALGKLAVSGSRRAPIVATASSTTIPFALKLLGTVVGLAVVAAVGSVYTQRPEQIAPNSPLDTGFSTGNSIQRLTATTVVNESTADSEFASAATTASLSGVVVFRDTGEVAPGMRVLIGAEDGQSRSALTDERGVFTFSDVPIGKMGLVAHDARHPEFPEDWLRSEHLLVSVAAGSAVDDITIEVPPLGGEISGLVTDRDTGVAIPGITIESYGPAHGQQVKTGHDGRYTILGLEQGEWRTSISRNNPIFHDSSSESNERVVVETGKAIELDFAVDRSISISGRVIDSDGAQVSKASVDAVLFMDGQSTKRECDLRVDASGRFTVWGGVGGVRAVLSARTKENEGSEIVSVDSVPGTPVRDVVLTLYPKQSVSGRFEDEEGKPVEATLWCRPMHADGPGRWRGYGDRLATTFHVNLARGNYELQARLENRNRSIHDIIETLTVDASDVMGAVVRIRSHDGIGGSYALRGAVTNESGTPLRNTRVYIDGAVASTMHSTQETHTDSTGRFVFEGLLDGAYRVHATPSPPYERFAGYDRINPAVTPEVKIVVRKAGRLRGRVVDAQTGDPVTSFRAEIGNYRGLDNEKRWELKKITVDSGQFDLDAQLDEDWFIRIEADGYAESVQTGSALTSGEVVDGIRFELSPGRVIHGVVVDHTGKPVSGALVFDNGDVFDVTRRSESYAATKTDAQGAFAIEGLADDARVVYILKSGYAVGEAVIRDAVEIVLTRGAIIDGHVLPANAVPSRRSRVSASTARNGHHDHYSSAINDEGYFRMENAIAGVYHIQFSLRDDAGNRLGTYYVETPVEAVDGMTTTQNLSIPLGSSVFSGVATRNGEPAPKLTLRYCREGIASYQITDEAGQFRIEGLPQGRVRIEAPFPNSDNPRISHYRTVADVSLDASAEVHLNIELSEFE